MKVGIIGLSKAGKTTVFNALTGSSAPTGTFGAKKANLAVIKVPDERVTYLSGVFNPKKTVFAEIAFVDVPGSEDGSHAALGGVQTIDLIKGVDTLAIVVRAFEDDGSLGIGPANPLADFEQVSSELIVLDLIVIEKKLERLDKERAKGTEYELFRRCKEWLETELPLRKLDLNETERKLLSGFQFLSMKPVLVLANTGESASADLAPLSEALSTQDVPLIDFCGALEMEIAALDESEQAELLEGLGIAESARGKFIRAAYELSNLISFLTVGVDEVRAWTIMKGSPAPQAGGKIHSDIERGFIRAEVISFDDFVEHNSLAKAREAGKVRLEGKDYEVKDGDIINFRFNV